MFATTIPTYSAPVPTVFNSTLSSAFENAKFTLSNGPNDLLTKLGNKATITADANVTLVQNRDCTVLIPNSVNRTVTLPSAVGQIFPIVIGKTSSNAFTITVNRAAAPDTVDYPYAPVQTPVTTSLVLGLPGEACMFIPEGTIWRVMVLNSGAGAFASAFNNVGQSLASGAERLVNYNTDTGTDLLGWWNTTTHTFQPTIRGNYLIEAGQAIFSGSASNGVLLLNKNGTRVGFGIETGVSTTSAFRFTVSAVINMNGTSDTSTITAFVGATRTTGGGVDSYWRATLIQRT